MSGWLQLMVDGGANWALSYSQIRDVMTMISHPDSVVLHTKNGEGFVIKCTTERGSGLLYKRITEYNTASNKQLLFRVMGVEKILDKPQDSFAHGTPTVVSNSSSTSDSSSESGGAVSSSAD
jgi:hypothetical protein